MNKGITIGISILFLGIAVAPLTQGIVTKESYLPIPNGNTLYVGGIGPSNYTKIQDAIDNSRYGDTVFVYNDSSPYIENIVINKPIHLIGEDKKTTVIDGGGSSQNYIVKIRADDVNIRFFTIRNGGVGIRVRDFNNCQISNSILSNNEEAGIYLEDSNSNTICNNTINSNNWLGALVWFSSNNMFINNTISENKIYGIWLHGSSDNTTVSNNLFKNNRK